MNSRKLALSRSARELWKRMVVPNDRIVVTGASGWFGRTVIELMRESPAEVLALASQNRMINVCGREVRVHQFDFDLIRHFQPTVVIDCAFLTRELAAKMSLTQYIEINRNLTKTILRVIQLPTVRAAVSISSGAAVHPHDALEGTIEDNPYGFLKRESEHQFSSTATEAGIGWSIARAWSVSGALVTKPNAFAISDLILQARTGKVNISATSEVYRKYSSVEDLLSLALAESASGGNKIFNSEGELVEIENLAETIVKIVNPQALVLRPPLESDKAHDYYSRSDDWPELTARHQLKAESLNDQIAKMNNYIPAIGSSTY